MKRKAVTARFALPLNSIDTLVSKQVLEGIGLVCLAWNEIETLVNFTLPLGLCIHHETWVDVSSRINGFDGKIAIIKKAIQSFRALSEDEYRTVCETLGRIEELKRLRDGVAHAHIANPSSPVAQSHLQRGNATEILLNDESLTTLYQHLSAAAAEMTMVNGIVFVISYLKRHPDRREETDETQRVEQIQRFLAQLRDYQHHRKQMPPLPEFPDPPPSAPESDTLNKKSS